MKTKLLIGLLIMGIIFISGCITPETAVQPTQGLQIVVKDLGFPEVKYLQPTIKEIQLQNEGGEWITIWSDPEGKTVKLTSDGAEMVLDTVSVEAGTYVGTRLLVSTIDVEADINRDGDTLDKNVQIILTLEEFNSLPQKERPSAPEGGGSPPEKPEQPPAPEQPPEPEKPQAPEKPQKITGAVASDTPQASEKPEKPPEPEKPSEPEKPGAGSMPTEPSPPYTIVNGIVYMPNYVDEVHTVTLNDYLVPILETNFVYGGGGGKIVYDFSLHPLLQKADQISVEVSIVNTPSLTSAASPESCSGSCIPNYQSCPAGTTAIGVEGCTPSQNCYRCGPTGQNYCCDPIPYVCCVTVPSVIINISSLSLSQYSVVKNASLVGTVTLDAAAPAGGQVVSLSSSSTTYLTVPPSVTVNAGATSATFNITTNPVTSSATVNITASLYTSRKTAQLTINPTATCSGTCIPNYQSCPAGTTAIGVEGCTPSQNCYRCGPTGQNYCCDPIPQVCCQPFITVAAVYLSPASVEGGSSLIGRVVLSGLVLAAGGQVVQLSAAPSAYLNVSSTITVKAGSKEGIFNISTKAVALSTDATITARTITAISNNVNKSARLSIFPKAAALSTLILSPASVAGGASSVGTIVLRGLAPAGGLPMQLSAYPSDYLTLPTDVTVKAGETNSTFNISTKAVTSPVNVTITTIYYNSRQTARLTINPTTIVNPATILPTTVLLDNFDGATKGKGFGALAYEDSPPNLGKAVNLTKGTYIKYSFSPWYKWDGAHQWNRSEAASGVLTEGRIEMWIKPRQYSRILTFNWGDAVSAPQAGYILHFGFNADGKLTYSVWGGNLDQGPVGKTIIPLNKWTRVAVSWGPNGTKLYVNGELDASTNANMWPAFSSGAVFVYLNYWGEDDLGLVDDFHISKVAEPPTTVLP